MKYFYLAGILLSFFIFLAAFRLVVIKILEDYFSKPKNKNHKTIHILGLLLISIWVIRFTMGIYSINANPDLLYNYGKNDGNKEQTSSIENDDQWKPNGFEAFFDSLLHAFQTFSMDEDYTEYLHVGYEMVSNDEQIKTHPNDYLSFPNWLRVLFGGYISVLNFSAPVAGSVVILQFLTGLFPGLRFWVASTRFSRKKKHVFSELNEHSLAAAKSVIRENPDAVMIFTHVYTDIESEKESELLLDAKNIGAICLKDDIIHLNFERMKNKTFYFIDMKEMNNIELFSKMASKEYYKALLNGTRVLIYYDDDSLVTIQRSAYRALEGILDKNGIKDEIPSVYRRDCNNELVLNLLHRYPLFASLKDNPDKKDIKVSIVGGGSIGLKMFLNAYWVGQIYGTKLHLNVVASEEEDIFTGKVEGVNPEILKTAVRGDTILSYNPDAEDDCVSKGEELGKDQNEEYFKFGYSKKKLEKCNIRDIVFEPYNPNKKDNPDIIESKKEEGIKNECKKDKLRESDYILVALGSDESNIYYANVLAREIELYKQQLGEKDIKEKEKKVTILYVVYDPEISEMLNSKPAKKDEENRENSNILTVAVGNVEETYSEKMITGKRFRELADAFDNAYSKIRSSVSTSFNSDNSDNLKKYYNFESSIARAIHLPYTMFSAFRLKGIDIDIFEEKHPEIIRKEALEKFFEIIKDENCDKQLGWLEHRRWNANLRSRGYRSTKTLKGQSGSKKDHRLKIHSCIVESYNKFFSSDSLSGDDKLDVVAKADKCDYKRFDNPSDQFSENQKNIIKYYEGKLNHELYS